MVGELEYHLGIPYLQKVLKQTEISNGEINCKTNPPFKDGITASEHNVTLQVHLKQIEV